jgi:hypothetical protein
LLARNGFFVSNLPVSRCRNLTVSFKPPKTGFLIKKKICLKDIEKIMENQLVIVTKDDQAQEKMVDIINVNNAKNCFMLLNVE